MTSARARRAVSVMLCAVLGSFGGCVSSPPQPDPMESMRPRIGRVVDADTGQPIAGAIVLDVFYLWPRRGVGDFPVAKVFRDSAETATDQEGRFRLGGPFDSRSWATEAIHIFKAGYGPWRFQGQTATVSDALGKPAQIAWLERAWEQFTTSGTVIELRPLRTREERLKYLDRDWDVSDRLEPGFRRVSPFGFSYFFDVPADRLARFQQAVDDGRANLGLPPRRLDGHRHPR